MESSQNKSTQKSEARPWAWIVWMILAISGAVAIVVSPGTLILLVDISGALILNFQVSALAFVIAVAFGWAMAALLRRPGWPSEAALVFTEPLYAFPPYLLLLFVTMALMPLLGISGDAFVFAAAALGMGHAARVAQVLRVLPLRGAAVALARRAVSVVRDSSLVSFVGLMDSVRMAKQTGATTMDFGPSYLVLFYVWAVLTLALHITVRIWENWTPTSRVV